MKYPKFAYKIADRIRKNGDLYPLRERLSRRLFLRKLDYSSLPPESEQEKKSRDALRSEIQKFPFERPDRKSVAENKWIKFKNDIREHILREDPRNFLHWPPVRYNMHYIPRLFEVEALKRSLRWKSFREALRMRSSAGIPFYAMPTANENSIRQAFHINTFLEVTGIDLRDIDQVFEFGGGYGSMGLLLRRLGFKGQYVIFDWPELSVLQKYYLSVEEPGADIHTINRIEDIQGSLKKDKKTLLIATWSLSECSKELRDRILRSVDPTYLLITYQKRFGDVDNREYFLNLQSSRNDILWKEIDARWEPSQENKYLIGVKKSDIHV